MAKLFLLSTAYLAVSVSYCFAAFYNETEETLRQNIRDLINGKLRFTDNNIPSFKNALDDITPQNNSQYDFIVIGAGSAGATIASRLSETKGFSVLLIEAGIQEYPIMDIPAMTLSSQFSRQMNWEYETESSDKYCLGMKDHKCKWPRGKVVGGSSVMNFLMVTRGNWRDYDEWVKMTGDESWSYDKMLKYFKKLESFHVQSVKSVKSYHNSNGPMYVHLSSNYTKYAKTFINAHEELGFPVNDYNGPKQMGVSYIQVNLMNNERWSANRGYLHPAKGRKNLFLTINSRVNKILINHSSKLAYGVQFTKNNKIIEVLVRKEIILSAGTIGSPQILMLSGIGPKKHLRDLGIKVMHDSPVGRNLMDHVVYPGLNFKLNDSETGKIYDLWDPRNSAVRLYFNERRGALSLPPSETLSYMNVDSNKIVSDYPNIELLFASTSFLFSPLAMSAFGISDQYKKEILSQTSNNSFYMMWPTVLRPKSRGKLLLRSKDPKDKPKIYPNYFNHPDDVRLLIKGIRAAIKISKTKAFQKYGSDLFMPLPCTNYTFDSDDYWECAIRTLSLTLYHPCGTCKMGKRNDRTAVVDSELRVIGIKGLRVVDASIMPKIVSGHLQVPVIAIAEKISDQIKKNHFSQPSPSHNPSPLPSFPHPPHFGHPN